MWFFPAPRSLETLRGDEGPAQEVGIGLERHQPMKKPARTTLACPTMLMRLMKPTLQANARHFSADMLLMSSMSGDKLSPRMPAYRNAKVNSSPFKCSRASVQPKRPNITMGWPRGWPTKSGSYTEWENVPLYRKREHKSPDHTNGPKIPAGRSASARIQAAPGAVRSQKLCRGPGAPVCRAQWVPMGAVQSTGLQTSPPLADRGSECTEQALPQHAAPTAPIKLATRPLAERAKRR